MRPKIVCDAAPFGYGPISKLVTLAKYLSEDYDILFLSTATAYDFLSNEDFETVKTNTQDKSNYSANRKIIEESDLYLNCMNRPSMALFSGLTKTAYVDSLFHMWDRIPEYLGNADYYFIQRFPGVEEQDQAFSGGIKNRIFVGPIIDDRFIDSEEGGNQLLVTMGGMESRLIRIGETSNYLPLMYSILKPVLEKSTYDRIIMTLPTNARNFLSSKHGGRIGIDFLERDDYLNTLSSSRAFMTTPGLTASLEGFGYGKPVYFLPSQNYSQYLNLKAFRAVGVADGSVDWNDVCDCTINKGLPEADGIKKILDVISLVDADAGKRTALSDRIDAMMSVDADSLAKKQGEFFRGLGGNGAHEIVKILRKELG